ncbi:MAG: nickel pincer cofactor biosynthesis protein LarC, partial [Dehalococcoidia bacterium]
KRVRVEVGDAAVQRHRRLADVLALLDAGKLPRAVHDKARAVFERIAAAEATVHGAPAEELTFHQVGQTDALIDVVGALLALDSLGVDRVTCSPLPLASAGRADGGHGPVPLPAPATLEILRAVRAPVRAADPADQQELVTPTGAAMVAELATFERPPLRLERIGVGAGGRDPAHRPNVLRAWLGDVTPPSAGDAGGGIDLRPVVVLETTVDDMTAEQVAFVRERAVDAGALDVWVHATGMKKGRSGLHLTVIARPEREAPLARFLLRETSTLGVRVREERRYEAAREQRRIETTLGPVTVKLKRLAGEPVQIAPEFEDCARLAQAQRLPIAEVYALVQREARAQIGEP